MSMKLRELIRAVRACKTAQEERAVIAKECALIRTAFKDNKLEVRHRNVAKLLFIHMLGYPSHFGQMECLKLIASPNFPEKRIGYLALMLLLDERTEVLTLVTNSLKNDLAHDSHYVVGLALTSIGNLATTDMARTLAPDVAKHLVARLGSMTPYTRKKAALTMIKVFKRVPEVIEDYIDKVVGLLKDRSHGVLIAAVQLMTDALKLSEKYAEETRSPESYALVKADFQRVVPSLVKMLRNLLNLGYSPEHDIAGVADPFLQVKLLRLLQLLGHKNEEASEAMNDVLAQVATNTETNRNAGNAILYECVRCIMSIESETGLRVLAINILGRFLSNRDNNIRYVALNSLTKVVSEDVAAVQRHRATILECLKDPDVSIRQRALELTYQLVNETNVRELTREMLNYLVVSNPAQVLHEHRSSLCSKVMTVVEKFAPSPRWRIETLVAMLGVAGNHCDEAVPCATVSYICLAPEELRGPSTHRLFRMLRDELPQAQLALIHVAVWCIGEFGDFLLIPCSLSSDDDEEEVSTAATLASPMFEAIPVAEILGLLHAVLKSHLATTLTKSYVLTALLKLTQRLEGQGLAETADLIRGFESSMSLELQQRSCEYRALLGSDWSDLRPEALARMPALDAVAVRAARSNVDSPSLGFDDFDDDFQKQLSSAEGGSSSMLAMPTQQGQQPERSLLDLDDIFGGGSPAPSAAPVSSSEAPPPAAAPVANDVDLLADIFAATPSPPAPPQPDVFGGGPAAAAAPQPADIFGGGSPAAAPNMMDDIFGGGPPAHVAAATPPPQITALEKNGFTVTMDLSRAGSEEIVLCSFKNSTSTDFERLVFQVAVPKYVEREMEPATSSTVPANNPMVVTQKIRLRNSQPTMPLKMLFKVQYIIGGRQMDEQGQVTFPAF